MMWATVLTIFAIASVAAAQLTPEAQEGVDLPRQPNDPIVGVLSQPNLYDWGVPCPTYVQKTYVDWLAQAGIRSAALRYDLAPAQMTAMLDQLNGVLFTGGMQNTTVPSEFFNSIQFITQYALERNAAGDKFVLWGTCQGFQVLAMAAANDQGILPCDYKGTMTSMLPLNLTTAANQSRLFSLFHEASPLLYSDLTLHNSTANAHNCGIDPQVFAGLPGLKDFVVISDNVDVTGRPFVSTFEHRTAEIYAVQWHPEAAQYWYDMGFNKEPSTLRVSNYMATFLKSRLVLNNRSFDDVRNSFNQLLMQYPLANNRLQEYTGFYCIDEPSIFPGTSSATSNGTTTWMTTSSVFIALFAALALICVYLFVKVRTLQRAVNSDRPAAVKASGYMSVNKAGN